MSLSAVVDLCSVLIQTFCLYVRMPYKYTNIALPIYQTSPHIILNKELFVVCTLSSCIAKRAKKIVPKREIKDKSIIKIKSCWFPLIILIKSIIGDAAIANGLIQ